jgi:group I intron endonuclease
MLQCGIYQIVNTITQDCYVGSSVNFLTRKRQHLNLLRKGIHHSQYLQSAYRKYGEDAFTFIFLEDVERDRKLLFQHEGDWIRLLQPQYNVGKLSETCLGVKRSEEVRKQMSLRTHSEETRRKQAEIKRGVKQSPEHIQNRAKGLQGHDVSEENRQKLAERSREMWANRTPEEKRAVIQKRSEETKAKNRQRMIALGKDPVRLERSRQANIGLKRSEETVRRLREAWVLRKQRELENPKPKVEDTRPPKEYKYSEERRRKMSEGKKASWDKKKAAQAETIQQQSLFD